MGPPSQNRAPSIRPGSLQPMPADVYYTNTNATNIRQKSVQPKLEVQSLDSNYEIQRNSNVPENTSVQQFPIRQSQPPMPYGMEEVQNQTRISQQSKPPGESKISVAVTEESSKQTVEGKKEEGGLLAKIFGKSSSSSEASLAGLNAALVHRLYNPADLVMQDDKGRRYSHRAMHYLGDRIEDNDLCFITMKPRGLPTDCTVKGNYVTVCRQNIILGPKGSMIEKVRLPVLKPEKTQSDDDNLILLPGPSQIEATHHLVNPDDPEGYTEYLLAKAEWEKKRPASVSSGESTKSSSADEKFQTRNLLKEKLLQEKEQLQMQRNLKKEKSIPVEEPPPLEIIETEEIVEPEEIPPETIPDEIVPDEIPPETVPDEVVPDEIPPEESPEILEENQILPVEVPDENKEEEPTEAILSEERNPADEPKEEEKDNADGDNPNVPAEGEGETKDEPAEPGEEQGDGNDPNRIIQERKLSLDPKPKEPEVIEKPPTVEKVPEIRKPSLKAPPPAPPPPKIAPNIALPLPAKKTESVDGKNTWLHNPKDFEGEESSSDSYGGSSSTGDGSGTSGSGSAESSEESTKKSEKPAKKSLVKEETESEPEPENNEMEYEDIYPTENNAVVLDQTGNNGQMGYGHNGQDPNQMMGGNMNPMMGGMMNPMLNGMNNNMMNPMMGGMNGMNQMMGGGISNMLDPLIMTMMMSMVNSMVSPPPPCYPCCYPCAPYGYDYDSYCSYESACIPPPSSKKPCHYGSRKKCPKKKDCSKCEKKEKYSSKPKNPSQSQNGTCSSKRSASRNTKIVHKTKPNDNREEDMNFAFLPQKGCCAEVTMTMDPDEPDPLLYALTHGAQPVVCCQMPPTLMMDRPMC